MRMRRASSSPTSPTSSRRMRPCTSATSAGGGGRPGPAAQPDGPPRKAPVPLGDVGGRRRKTGADRPNRLVGDDSVGGPRASRQRAAHLSGHDIERVPCLALFSSLAHADDPDQAPPPCPNAPTPHIPPPFA